MRNIILLAFFVLVMNCSYSQNIENDIVINGDFECWVNENDRNIEPEHWHTIVSATGKYADGVSKQIYKSTMTRPGSDGKYSVLLKPRNIFGVLANGNLTNGRINAGSLRPANHEENYNYTQRDNQDFCTPINNVPDSIVAWLCFRAMDSESEANFVSVVHGDVDFIYSGIDFCRPEHQMCAISGPCHIKRTCNADSDNYVWRRVSVPFVIEDENVKPSYILILFSTNRMAGEGSSKDELFIDDVELIYNK